MKPQTEEYPFPADYPPARVIWEAADGLSSLLHLNLEEGMRYQAQTLYDELMKLYKVTSL